MFFEINENVRVFKIGAIHFLDLILFFKYLYENGNGVVYFNKYALIFRNI